MSRAQLILCWLFQITASAILAFAGIHKMMSADIQVEMFTSLGMEPTGRYIIGTLEIIAAFFLLTDALSAAGALLGLAIMLGAIIAHSTVLGVSPTMLLLFTVVICCLIVAYIRRENLPFVGKIMW